jgi:hypothetical protein
MYFVVVDDDVDDVDDVVDDVDAADADADLVE